MNVLMLITALVAALVILDIAAMRTGADTRDGFGR